MGSSAPSVSERPTLVTFGDGSACDGERTE